MALVMCEERGREIAKSAKACPNCGAKPKRAFGFTAIAANAIGPMAATWIKKPLRCDDP